eukprot:TRINITY_DN65248_c0_g1_i1.p1 TRINITY_DN65248_c0_g1~~TRINITY_DN65248_c0_g1_i1.p1  ORF type:complete len:214 (+),score=20.27 TRINITY_DN65248_c0_g1_i1:54-695(+)
MATLGEMLGSNKRARWADLLSDSEAEHVPDQSKSSRESLHLADCVKRPRWADMHDSSSTEQLPELPDPLRNLVCTPRSSVAEAERPPETCLSRVSSRVSGRGCGAARTQGGISHVSKLNLKRPVAARAKAATRTKALNASDEEWQRRLEKRCAIVAALKEKPAYQERLASRQRRRERGEPSRSPSAVRTPNPHDREISKRLWEAVVADWRRSV